MRWGPKAYVDNYNPHSGITHEVPYEQTVLHVGISGPGKLPTRGTDEAAGWDLYANESVQLKPDVPTLVGTGIRLVMPAGWEGHIRERSGLAYKERIRIGAGTIDSDYRNEIKVLMILHGSETTVIPYPINPGDRIAQILFKPVPKVIWQQLNEDEFSSFTSDRGLGGFGSTGK